MKSVCFIGSHFGLSQEFKEKAKDIIVSLINNDFKTFYCGMYGDFDMQINSILYSLKKDYDIVMICVKPYYNENKFLNHKAKENYQTLKNQIMFEYDKYDDIEKRIEYMEEEYKYEFFKNDYIYEKKVFDKVTICELDNIPYKYRIIECNKWKVKNSDVLVTFCTNKYSNSYKIRNFALKINKKVIDINNNF